jgi:hypothetical protein
MSSIAYGERLFVELLATPGKSHTAVFLLECIGRTGGRLAFQRQRILSHRSYRRARGVVDRTCRTESGGQWVLEVGDEKVDT